MPLTLHRSNRMERLVAQLAAALERPPADPFAEVPVVVGSRGMERWLRHQLATHSRHGVAAQVAFPFPRQAFDGAVQAVLAGRSEPGAPPFWQGASASNLWQPEVLAFRVVGALRRRAAGWAEAQGDVDFSGPYDFLSGAEGVGPGAMRDLERPIGARELTFAVEVAECLERVLRRRPELARSWLSDNDVPPAQGWLAALLRDLISEQSAPNHGASSAAEGAPLAVRDRLARAVSRSEGALAGSLHVFGLSTLGVDDLHTLTALAPLPELDLHLYILTPTQAWIGEDRSLREVHREMRRVAGALEPEPGRLRLLAAELESAESLNPLLTDLGKPSRDLQQLLEEAGDFPAIDVFEAPEGDGALAILQRDLLHATWVGSDARTPLSAVDRSLSFHPCHGPLRQVEMLRELLLHAFAEDAELGPRDVLIMTPDVATFAPLVEAVFAHRRGPVPAIPVHVADLGLRALNPVADVLLTLLESVRERFDVPQLLSMLALEPLRRRFGLSPGDLQAVEHMLDGAGARWGFDAEDRVVAQQPRQHQNTFAFAWERIALGVLMLDEPERLAAGDATADPAALRRTPERPEALDACEAVAPWDATTAEGQRQFAQVYSCVQALRFHREALGAGPVDAAAWRERLDAALADLTETTDEAAWLTGRVVQELDRAFAPLVAAGLRETLDLDAVRALLKGRFEVPRQGDRQITGAVTVCAMEPMRSVPFAVVALLGMDDGTYPRTERRRAWDPLSRTPRRGEHQRRDVDRHLLLEALLSARERMVVLWTGHDVRSGEPKPPAVLVSELQDAVDRRFVATVEGSQASAQLTFAGTLQPWSERAYADGRYRAGAPMSFDAALRDAADALGEVRAGARRTSLPAVRVGRLNPGLRGRAMATPSTPERSVSVDVLARELCAPQRRLLQSGFGVHFAEAETEVRAREPLELNGLERWQLRDEALHELAPRWPTDAHELAEAALTRLQARWRAEGRLPVGVVGESEVAEQLEQAQGLLAGLSLQLGPLDPTPLQPRTLAGSALVQEPDGEHLWALHGAHGFVTRLGALDNAAVLVSLQAASDKPRRRLAAWLHLLASAAEPATALAGALVVVRTGRTTTSAWWLRTPTRARAAAMLSELIALWQRTTTEAVPLLPEVSPSVAEALASLLQRDDTADTWAGLDLDGRRRVRSAAMSGWSAYGALADGDDPWVTAVFPEPDWATLFPDPPEPGAAAPATESDPEGWVATAMQVWGPLMPGLWTSKLGVGAKTTFAARAGQLLRPPAEGDA